MTVDPDRQAEKQLVRSRSRIDEVARELAGCEWEPRGPGDLWACCPFHSEDTPSFHVRVSQGVYKCFGCGASGDVFRFVQEIRGVGFREALEMLAERAGVTLGSLSPEDKRRQAEVRDLRRVLERAGQLFAQALRTPAGARAVDYLKSRGFEGKTAAEHDVGLVPDDFLRRLREGGLANAAIDRAGFTHAFAGRLSFGIRDANGGLVGFGARTLDPDGKPKYVNTRETSAFNKRRLLYALDKASRAVSRSRRLVVMEGYTDVLMAHQRGVLEAVATMGTSLTKDHVRLLKGRASNLIFVFDGDEAGLTAAERAVHLTLEEGMEVRVLCLPDGSDPGDWFREHDAEAFEALLAKQGLSTVAFLCRRAIDRADRNQPGWREAVAHEVLEACRSLIDPVRRETVAGEIARACHVNRNVLRRHVTPASPTGGTPVRHPPRAGRVSARISSQFALLVGLTTHDRAAADVERLDRAGVLSHPHAQRLLEVARGLGPGLEAGLVDPMDWLDATREQDERLAVTLDRALFSGPDSVLPGYETALSYLEGVAEEEHAKQVRLAARNRPDIHDDEPALRAIEASLKERDAAKRRGARNPDPEGAAPDDPAPDRPNDHPLHHEEAL